MSHTMMDTMKTAKHDATAATEHALGTAKDALGTAKDAVESAKESTMQTYARSVSTVLKGISTVSGLITMLKGLDSDDGLAWFGLARRRPLRSLGFFSAGMAVGAGAGMLFAPMSGADLRRMMLQSFMPAKDAASVTPADAKPAEVKPEEPKPASANHGEGTKHSKSHGAAAADHQAS